MVSRFRPAPRPARRPAPDAASSRDRLLAAAAEEFAARGFDGAKVDRIAARARVNKALLYYYFRNKAALYREVLLDLFRTVAGTVAGVRDAGGSPEAQLVRYIEAVAGEIVRRPLFPAMWLREMAEGGRHVDESIVLEMRRVVETLGGILAAGQREGVFMAANPLVTQIGIIAPLLFFAATAPVRERFGHLMPASGASIPRDLVVDHVRRATLAALRVGDRSPTEPPATRTRRQKR
jgi:TetR/AcrR family transcriptional regulator